MKIIGYIHSLFTLSQYKIIMSCFHHQVWNFNANFARIENLINLIKTYLLLSKKVRDR